MFVFILFFSQAEAGEKEETDELQVVISILEDTELAGDDAVTLLPGVFVSVCLCLCVWVCVCE